MNKYENYERTLNISDVLVEYLHVLKNSDKKGKNGKQSKTRIWKIKGLFNLWKLYFFRVKP